MPQNAMQWFGKGNPAAAVSALRAAAGTGDPAAMFWLGRTMEEVQGIPHDYAEAMRWYRQAADRGLGVAAWSLGRLFELGRGASPSPSEAQTWYAKAAQLGFRRTGLTILRIRWFPGPQELTYEPAPDSLRNPPVPPPQGLPPNPPIPDLTKEELEMLRKDGLRGKLVWQGGEAGRFGLPARATLIARAPVTEEVALAMPRQGSLIYIQEARNWRTLGAGDPGKRTLRIHPQSPEMPWITGITLEMEDGGSQGTTGWVWERR
ncbi:MAG TPA: tetratricopeptide repeat protein [Bryobacteraceae bacterium]|nr:tetratricopeptide repeat protein [Bryobacteraceae bacterium]